MSNLQQLRLFIRSHCRGNIRKHNKAGHSFNAIDKLVSDRMTRLDSYFNEDEIVVVFFAEEFHLFTEDIYDDINHKVDIAEFCEQLHVDTGNFNDRMLCLYDLFAQFLKQTIETMKKHK